MELKENCIEWITGDDTITLSLSQKRYVNKVKNIAKKHKDKVTVIENEDGSIYAKMPLKTLKLSIIEGRNTGFFKKAEEDEETE